MPNAKYYPDGSSDTPALYTQIECPSEVPQDTGGFKGLKYAASTAFPQSLGYIIGGNFTGVGKNDDSFLGKTGLDFVNGYSGSKRIYGQNYYIRVGDKTCGQSSKDGCNGQPAYIYLRSYPVGVAKANLSFAVVEDLLDINPISVIISLFDTTGSIECHRPILPVGNSFDLESNSNILPNHRGGFINVRDIIMNDKLSDEQKQNRIKKRIQFLIKKCNDTCQRQHTDSNSKRDNCYKDCKRIWWEENKCSVKQKGLSYVNVNYPVYINVSVVLTENNIRFFLPTGAVILIISQNSLKHIGGANNKHALHVIGVTNGRSPRNLSVSVTTKLTYMDDRMKYEAQYNRDSQLYTLHVYALPLSRPPVAAIRFAVNVNNNYATYQEKSGREERTKFRDNKNGSSTAQFRKKRRTVPYKIPAVSLSPKEEKENNPDMRSLEAYETWPSDSTEPTDGLQVIRAFMRGFFRMAITPAFMFAIILIVLLLVRQRLYERQS